VGLCLERSLESIVAILGILKAGGAYVALDPDYPKERLEQMLAETRAPVLLTQERLASTLPQDGTRVIRLDTEWASIAQESQASQANPNPDVGPDNLAYVVYTSGSTGKAKGTCIPHRAVVRLVRNTNFASMAEDEVFLQFATLSFDASTLELWGSLLNGGRLVIYPAGTPSLEELGDVIQSEAVTTLWLTAGLFHQMIEQQAESLRGLRQLLAGGDALSVPHVQMALEKLEGCTLINGYGPTENTTFTCCHPMRRGEASGEIERTVPIGRPISNTTVYVLDRQLRPVPIGVPGDLYTGGDGLARGYLHHPELTAERFVPDPFGARPGGRLYRTGDRARSLSGGVIEFLGRDDNQVKVRGFRIELGEIESVLGTHPAVRDTVVLARADDTDEKRLVAYVVADSGSSPGIGELRAWLEERLPGYMVPAAFVNLDAFPLTTNGKVDRKALPAPEGTRPELDTAYAAPEADLERAIADIWRELLGLETVGVHDNFFDLGGHSMLLIRVHGKLKASLHPELRMVDLFRYPTIRALAQHLGQGETMNAPEPVDAAEKRAAGRERLQRLQQRRRGGGAK
jgi:amino acid adenylation domain-containing protein